MLGTTFRAVRSLSPHLQALFATTLIFRSGTMAFPFLAAYLLERDTLSDGQAGVVVGAFGVGALVADLSAGPLLRIASARTVMAAGLVSHGLLLAAVPFVHSVPALLFITAMWGFFYECFSPAAYTTIVHNTESATRKVAYSCHRMAINIGMAIGPAIGGFVYLVAPSALFVINAIAVGVAAVYVVSHRVDVGMASEETKTSSTAPASTGPGDWRSESRFWTFFVLSLPIHFAFALPTVYLSGYATYWHQLPSTWVGLVFTVNAIVIVLFEVPLNAAMSNVSHTMSLLIGCVLTAVGFALMGLFSTGWGFMAATVVWTAAEMVIFPALMHYASDVSAAETLNRNMGLCSAGMNIGLIVAPALAVTLAATLGPASPWLIAAALAAVTALIIVAVRRVSFLWLPGA